MAKLDKKKKQLVITEPTLDGDIVLYAVLKLIQDVIYINPFTNKQHKEKLQGIAGFIPCFTTYEEAEEASCDGKFQIVAIRPASIE